MDIDVTTLTDEQLDELAQAVSAEQAKRKGNGAHTNGPPTNGGGGPPPGGHP